MIWKPGQKSGSGKAGNADLRFAPRRNFIKGAIGHNLQQSKGNGGQKEKGKHSLKKLHALLLQQKNRRWFALGFYLIVFRLEKLGDISFYNSNSG